MSTNPIYDPFRESPPESPRQQTTPTTWVNQGELNWKLFREEWTRKTPSTNDNNTTNLSNSNNNVQDSPKPRKPINAQQIYEDLLNEKENKVFDPRIPLPDLVSILVEVWETEGLLL